MIKNGFVDLQVNGYKGLTFTSESLTIEEIRKITEAIAGVGTIAYCPTFCTNSVKLYEHVLPLFARAMKDKDIARHILGLHLEGPFISPVEGARGAHPPEYIIKPDADLLKRFQELAEGHIVLLTIAPETENALPLIKCAARIGIRVSMGHHLAEDDCMERAVRAGASASTHLGNGMPNMINRHQNPIWWQLACDDVYGMFITDGNHLPADFIKVAWRAKGPEKFIVVSDAAHIAGLPPGEYEFLGKKAVLAPDGRISFANTPYLAGSSANMLQCMNHLASLNLLTEKELWKAGLENPLKFLGKTSAALSRDNGALVEFRNNHFKLRKN